MSVWVLLVWVTAIAALMITMHCKRIRTAAAFVSLGFYFIVFVALVTVPLPVGGVLAALHFLFMIPACLLMWLALFMRWNTDKIKKANLRGTKKI